MDPVLLDTAWLLLCAGLVFLMQAGFMCLESGLTRAKNSISVAVKNLTDIGISVVVFWALGSALMFSPSHLGWYGTTGFFADLGQSDIRETAFFVFQAMFCGTSVTIVSGAVAERMRFAGYLIVALIMSSMIYPVFGHWAWNGALAGIPSGWLNGRGFVDFAGGTVVHSLAGWVALAAVLRVGSRTGRFPPGQPPQKIPGHNLPVAMLGTVLLWFGWFGFNGGSTFAMNEQVPRLLANTLLAGASGMVAALVVGWPLRERPDVDLVINGSLAGLVSITANCHAVTALSAVVIGSVGGLVMLGMTYLLERWHIDDAVGAIPVHAGGGVWGTVAVALFGRPDLLATGLDRGTQLLVQFSGIIVCFLWAFGMMSLVLYLIDRLYPLRVSSEEEYIGLNVAEHNATTEHLDLLRVMESQARTGDLSLRVPIEPFTEVGQIATLYNRVMEEIERLAERLDVHNRFIRQTFGRYLTDDVVSNLLDSPEGLVLGGETRQVTLLMADLRGFTSLSERVGPTQVVIILNRYLGVMSEVIQRYRGTIDEFIGDAIFVIFGAPTWQVNDGERAVACAVAMQSAMTTVNDQNCREGLPAVAMGIAVHTGEVVVGNIGSDRRAKYGVVGHPVNLTARIESYTLGRQILISEATRQEAGASLHIIESIEIEAKGMDRPLTVHDVRGIGGAYNIFLPPREDARVALTQEILLCYTVLEGKRLGGLVHTGSFVTLSRTSAEVRTAQSVEPWSDIKIQLIRHDGDPIAGDLYAKVAPHPPADYPGFAIDFTFVSTEIAAFFQRLLSPQPGMASAV